MAIAVAIRNCNAAHWKVFVWLQCGYSFSAALRVPPFLVRWTPLSINRTLSVFLERGAVKSSCDLYRVITGRYTMRKYQHFLLWFGFLRFFLAIRLTLKHIYVPTTVY